MEINKNKKELVHFDPLGIFNLNIQSELYAKELLNGGDEVIEVNEILTNINSFDLTSTKNINKVDHLQ